MCKDDASVYECARYVTAPTFQLVVTQNLQQPVILPYLCLSVEVL